MAEMHQLDSTMHFAKILDFLISYNFAFFLQKLINFSCSKLSPILRHNLTLKNKQNYNMLVKQTNESINIYHSNNRY